MRRAWWLVIGLLLALPLWLVTLSVAAGRSCGAYDSGPDTAAQRSFCGDAATGYSVTFHLVSVIPAVIVLAGAVASFARRSHLPLLVAVAAAVVAALTVWTLIP